MKNPERSSNATTSWVLSPIEGFLEMKNKKVPQLCNPHSACSNGSGKKRMGNRARTLVPDAHHASGSLHPRAVSGGFGQEAEEGFQGKTYTAQLP